MKFTILSSAILIILFSGCSKKEDAGPTKHQLLTAGPWELKSSTTTNLSSGVITDNLAFSSACNTDDRYFFKEDNTYEWEEGLTKCRPADPQVIVKGNWQFIGETVLKVNYVVPGIPAISREFTILSLALSEMKLENTDGTNRYTLIYRHY